MVQHPLRARRSDTSCCRDANPHVLPNNVEWLPLLVFWLAKVEMPAGDVVDPIRAARSTLNRTWGPRLECGSEDAPKCCGTRPRLTQPNSRLSQALLSLTFVGNQSGRVPSLVTHADNRAQAYAGPLPTPRPIFPPSGSPDRRGRRGGRRRSSV